MTKIIYAACIASLLALGACKGSGGSKCEQAIRKSMEIGMEIANKMSAMAGDEAKAKQEKFKADMEAKIPAAVAKCEEAIKGNPDFEKAIDCILSAEGVEGLSKCDSGALNGLMK